MSKKKMSIGTIDINKKFKDQEEASRYAKRLREYIRYICKKYNYQASVMTVISNTKSDVTSLRYVHNGKRGRPRKQLVVMNTYMANVWYKGNFNTDWHIHILIVSKPSYALRNHIKKYVDKNWINVANIREKKEFDISMLNKKKVYKKTCNIKIADYFINQSAEIRFMSCNYSDEHDFKYSLKDYYKEYMKFHYNYIKLHRKNKSLGITMSEEEFIKRYAKIESKFKMIENYFYNITKEDEEKARKDFLKEIKISKIMENYNKMQNVKCFRTADGSLFIIRRNEEESIF